MFLKFFSRKTTSNEDGKANKNHHVRKKERKQGQYFMREVTHSDPHLDYQNAESKGLDCGRRDGKRRYLQAAVAIKKDDVSELRHILAVVSTRSWVEQSMNSRKETLFMHCVKDNAEKCALFLYEDKYDLWIGYKNCESILKREIKQKMNDDFIRLLRPTLFEIYKKILNERRRKKRQLRERPSFIARKERKSKHHGIHGLVTRPLSQRMLSSKGLHLHHRHALKSSSGSRDFDDDDDDDESTGTLSARPSLSSDIWAPEHLPTTATASPTATKKQKSARQQAAHSFNRNGSTARIKSSSNKRRPFSTSASSTKSIKNGHSNSQRSIERVGAARLPAEGPEADPSNAKKRPQSIKIRPTTASPRRAFASKKFFTPKKNRGKAATPNSTRPKSVRTPRANKWLPTRRSLSQRAMNESIWAKSATTPLQNDNRKSQQDEDEDYQGQTSSPKTYFTNLLFCSDLGHDDKSNAHLNDDDEDNNVCAGSYLLCDQKAIAPDDDEHAVNNFDDTSDDSADDDETDDSDNSDSSSNDSDSDDDDSDNDSFEN